jgi:small ligand-binding sensory domain FIST
MPFAAALSEHPLATEAVGEVAGQVLERLATGADLAVLFVTAPHTGALEDIAGAVRTLLQPGCLIGATASAVLGSSRGVEDRPGVALWAGRFSGTVTPVHLVAERVPAGMRIAGFPPETEARTLLLLPDPFTFPVGGFVESLTGTHPGLTVIGGMASAARGPGGNRLVVDDRVVSEGAVGALLDVPVAPGTVVSQGCRPIGTAWTVTRAEGNVLYELGGRPALERLVELLQALSPADKDLAAQGLHCGIVVDEHKLDFERGDFLIRGVMGVDRDQGTVIVGDVVPVGATVQFQVRDARTAGEDLAHLLDGRSADSALVFTCNGRGAAMFGDPNHDAALVQDVLGPIPTAGMFCAGEIGPVSGTNALHGFTASVALFRDP